MDLFRLPSFFARDPGDFSLLFSFLGWGGQTHPPPLYCFAILFYYFEDFSFVSFKPLSVWTIVLLSYAVFPVLQIEGAVWVMFLRFLFYSAEADLFSFF